MADPETLHVHSRPRQEPTTASEKKSFALLNLSINFFRVIRSRKAKCFAVISIADEYRLGWETQLTPFVPMRNSISDWLNKWTGNAQCHPPSAPRFSLFDQPPKYYVGHRIMLRFLRIRVSLIGQWYSPASLRASRRVASTLICGWPWSCQPHLHLARTRTTSSNPKVEKSVKSQVVSWYAFRIGVKYWDETVDM